MNRINRFRALFISITLISLAGGVLAEDTHWGYDGDHGPDHWGELSETFALCGAGMAQSPIDIRDASRLDLVDIVFHYEETANNIYNNSHTIQVEVDEGNYIVYNGIRYDLLQFHFHAPSEHTVDGVAAAMENHFVHLDRNSGNLAVIGLMMLEGEVDHEGYAAVFDHLPAEVGEPEAVGEALELDTLLPEERAFYTYQGSLTTPPCSEIVRWLVLDEAVELSPVQLDAFTAIYDANARPVQPLGLRDLLQDG